METRTRALVSATIFSALSLVYLLRRGDVYNFVLQLFPFVTPGVANIIISTVIGLLLSLLTAWVLFFKGRERSLWVVSLFPALVALPVLLTADTLIGQIRNNFGQVTFLFLVAVGTWLISYLILLTANVINGFILYKIPLGMAGKAAQFIFILISTYAFIGYLISNINRIEVRILMLFTYCTLTAVSALWSVVGQARESINVAITIALQIVLVFTLLSIWPLSAVWVTLLTVLVDYVLLNMALETRQKVTGMIWFEYGLLLALAVVVLLLNASWGINGSLI